MTGEAFTIWSVRAATVLYVAALMIWLTARTMRAANIARLAWTLGCLCYLAHVFGAFQFVHGWSHSAAYLETARQTRELTGFASGSGLYFNYVFTVVWLADAVWWWLGTDRYEQRPRWITAVIHGFLAFMFVNATVVFASGFSRWLGAVAIPAVSFAWWKGRRHSQRRRQAPNLLASLFSVGRRISRDT